MKIENFIELFGQDWKEKVTTPTVLFVAGQIMIYFNLEVGGIIVLMSLIAFLLLVARESVMSSQLKQAKDEIIQLKNEIQSIKDEFINFKEEAKVRDEENQKTIKTLIKQLKTAKK